MSGAIACFGEAVFRLGPPPGELLLSGPRLEAHPGGAEVNVAAALAALGHQARLISALPDDALGDAAIWALRARGLDTASCLRRAGRLGVYYLVPGTPATSAQVIYDRAGSAFAETPAGEWDWIALLDGCNWLHISGVTPALGRESALAAVQAARHAREAGLTVSFDGNWRGRLWERWDGEPRAILSSIVEQADVLFGNHRDAALLLDRSFGGDGPDRRREAACALLDRFPALSLVASTARTVIEQERHSLVARIDTCEDAVQTDAVEIVPVVDRIGGGDAFAAGIIDGLRRGVPHGETLRLGLALTAIKHGLRGDNAPVSRAMLEAGMAGPADVVR